MKKPKLREIKEALTALFRGPYTTKFPFEPHQPPEGYRGAPKFFEEGCVGCNACVQACPAEVIDTVDEVDEEKKTGKRILTLHYDRCQFCGTCEASCITQEGVKLTQEFNLATLDRSKAIVKVEKELVLCEVCGEAIGARDHLLWLAKRLGPLAYTNPSLLLAAQKDLALIQDVSPRPEGTPLTRADYLRLLCPKCKHELFIQEEWK